MNLTDQAMRSALISSLRGGASTFIEYVGLDSPFDVMIDEFVECYCITATHNTLVCEFHQLSQEGINILESLRVGLRKSLRSYKGKFQSIIPISHC